MDFIGETTIKRTHVVVHIKTKESTSIYYLTMQEAELLKKAIENGMELVQEEDNND